jgi:hypothetical protein
MNTYGNFPLRVTTDSIDKVGIRHLVMAQKWAPPRSGMGALDIVGAAPAAPTAPAWMGLIGIDTRPAEGCLETRWTYEGASGTDSYSGLKDRTNSLDYDFEAGFQSVDIKLFPTFATLLKNFAGTVDPSDGTVQWAVTLTQQQASANGLAGGSQTPTANPMYGVQDFYRMEGTYTYRYASLGSLPQGLYDDKIGAAFTTGALPGTPPTVTQGRNWLKCPPRYKRRGPVFDITEIYWLSGPGGWPAPVYPVNTNPATGQDL